MPKGSPNAQTKSSEKYQQKTGYMSKTFKLKRDIIEQFANTCMAVRVSQAGQLTVMTKEFIEHNEKK